MIPYGSLVKSQLHVKIYILYNKDQIWKIRFHFTFIRDHQLELTPSNVESKKMRQEIVPFLATRRHPYSNAMSLSSILLGCRNYNDKEKKKRDIPVKNKNVTTGLGFIFFSKMCLFSLSVSPQLHSLVFHFVLFHGFQSCTECTWMVLLSICFTTNTP